MSEQFDKNYFFDLLKNINQSNVSIKNVSNYMCNHRENNNQVILKLFKDLFYSINDPEILLSLFYTINEVIFMSALKSKNEYIVGFGDCLKDLVLYLTNKTEEYKSLIKFLEIIKIWENMMIYSHKFTKELKDIANKKVSF